MKRYLLIGFTILLALSLAACTVEEEAAPELLTPVGARMDTAVAARGAMTDILVYEAAVAPRHKELYFTHDSRIGQIPVSLGQSVSAGDPVIYMDVSAIQSEIAALDAEKSALEAAHAYDGRLYEIDMEIYALELSRLTDALAMYDMQTDMELYELESKNAEATRTERLQAIEVARAALEARLSDTALIAPCDGRVVYIGAYPGQSVKAYDAVCVVTEDSDLVIQSDYIAESTLSNAVELYALIGGARYELTPEAVDEDAYARAVLKGSKYQSIFTVSGTDTLRPGQTAAICIVTAHKDDALKIPINALFTENGEHYVYAIENGARVRRDVQAGLVTTTEAEILSGLAEGEVVYVGN